MSHSQTHPGSVFARAEQRVLSCLMRTDSVSQDKPEALVPAHTSDCLEFARR
jgi:hypothetical protein